MAGNSTTIKVSYETSKWLSIGVVLLISLTLIIGIVALSGGKQSFNEKQQDILDTENFKVMEHMSTEDANALKNIKLQLGSLKAEIGSLKKKPSSPIYKVTNNKVIAPANRTSGTHYAIGPLISKKHPKEVLTCPPLTDTNATPTLQKSDGFISPDKIWSYEIDGTIRTAYNKIKDKMGSCMQVRKNNNITMTENSEQCSSWTWNAKGQLQYVQSGSNTSQPKCLTLSKTGNEQGINIDYCSNDSSPDQVWSFFTWHVNYFFDLTIFKKTYRS